MYCFGGNHRYSLFEDFWEHQVQPLGGSWGQPWMQTLEEKIFKEKFFGYSNPGQIDDFHLMRLSCLSIYIRNITYWTTVIQRIKKNEFEFFCSLKMTACCPREGIQLNMPTLSSVSAILSGNQSGNETGKLAWSVQSQLFSRLRRDSECPAGCSQRNSSVLILILELNYSAVPRLLICSLSRLKRENNYDYTDQACLPVLLPD